MSSWGALLRRGHLGTEADRATHRTLHTALLASPPLRMGLSAAAAEKSLKHLRALLGAPAVAMTDTSGLLAWDGVPTILYSLFWKRFNTRGALWSIYGGLVSAITLIIFSPVVSGKAVDAVTKKSPSMLQGVDFHWFRSTTPASSRSRSASSSATSGRSRARSTTRPSMPRWRSAHSPVTGPRRRRTTEARDRATAASGSNHPAVCRWLRRGERRGPQSEEHEVVAVDDLALVLRPEVPGQLLGGAPEQCRQLGRAVVDEASRDRRAVR